MHSLAHCNGHVLEAANAHDTTISKFAGIPCTACMIGGSVKWEKSYLAASSRGLWCILTVTLIDASVEPSSPGTLVICLLSACTKSVAL